jgi:formate dehydrogenase iron-sulfur subunit
VERFSQWHDASRASTANGSYHHLIPLTAPAPGQQYAFEVNLDQCSGCKACVTACHSLNGLDETETWRSVGLLVSDTRTALSALHIPHSALQQHVTTACHHCADPGCANGCPVLAYDKDPVTGIVRHLDDQCMGCSYCVMKCPYEVPKYSNRLGIVRKCDLCSQRLAVGEAPACVQACPNEAIKITLIEKGARAELFNRSSVEPSSDPAIQRFSSSANHFLPDSPDPRLTLPTTRFLSAKLPADLVAADHAAPRLDHPHWPLVIMLVLTQSAAGLFLAAAIAATAGVAVKPLTIAACVGLNAGLVAAVLHLGQPLKAWRAFLGWRKSWLSREIIAFNAFAAVALLAIFHPPASGLAAGFGLAAVFTSAMVYVDTRRPFWSPRGVLGNFYGTTLLLGAAFAAVGFGWMGQPGCAQPFAAAALVLRTGLFLWRRLELRAARRNPASAIHLNARAVGELLVWTTQTRNLLFLVSTLFGALAVANVAPRVPVWASVAALTTVSSEIIGRYVFFAASASKRMPGGFAS